MDHHWIKWVPNQTAEDSAYFLEAIQAVDTKDSTSLAQNWIHMMNKLI